MYMSLINFHKQFLLLLNFFIICILSGCNTNDHSNFVKDNTEVSVFSTTNDSSDIIETIDLGGNWKFKAADETEWMDASVPGTVQEDLIRSGKLIDPFYRDNEFDAQWVEKKEWIYEREFVIKNSYLEHDKIFLDCRGLDTLCDLFLNDSLVAQTKNMFIEYEFDVKKYLHRGNNNVRAIFHRISDWNQKQVASDSRVSWAMGNHTTNDALKGLLFYSRKEASDFGWDWGIRLLSCGIWRPIRLTAFDTGRIKELGVMQDLSNPSVAMLSVKATIESFRSSAMKIDVIVTLEGKAVTSGTFPVKDSMVFAQLSIHDPKLWWPNGLGEHPLYTVTAKLIENGKKIHSREIRLGLRTIQLHREKDRRGETFGFKVNGKLIFCKGANWIPADALPNRLIESQYKLLLSSCIESNMNMIRVWGGGLYESDYFYDFCDAHGLMIWHDFMFATGPYLAEESYLKNVKEEIKSVVLRLRNHPSIALWCGNNESELI